MFYTSVRSSTTNTTAFAGIGVLALDGTHKKLISTGKKPRGIVVDPKEGYVFPVNVTTATRSLPVFILAADVYPVMC